MIAKPVYLLALAAPLILAPTSLATQTQPKPSIQTLDLDTMRAALSPLDLKWEEVEDGEGLIAFNLMEGETAKFAIYQYLDKPEGSVTSIGISAGYDLPRGADLKVLNAWNASTRFTKAYADEDVDPYLTQDLDLTGGISIDRITEFVRSFIASQKEFESKVIGKDLPPTKL